MSTLKGITQVVLRKPLLVSYRVFSVGIVQEHPTSKNRKNALNAVYCFLISFYGLLKGYLSELTLFYLFGCGS